MRKVFLDRGSIRLQEVAHPELNEHTVLVEVMYSFISSGTERATIASSQKSLISDIPQKVKKVLQSVSTTGMQGTAALIKGKLKGSIQSLGYSCAGKVIAVGAQVPQVRPGDWVACAGAECAHHAELVAIPYHLLAKLSDESYARDASITTIGTIAMHGVRQAKVQLGETVAVIGLGLLGQLSIQLLLSAGCRVIGIDLNHERLALAKQFGAQYVYHAQEENIAKAVQFATDQHGVDAAIITAGSPSNQLIEQAVTITKKRGTIVVVGDVGLQIPRELWYPKEINLRISCSYGPGRYDTQYEQQGVDYPFSYVRWTEQRNMQAFIDLLAQKKVLIEPLISAQYMLDDIAQAYEQIQQSTALGVVIEYPKKQEAVDPPAVGEVCFVPAKQDAVRVGIIGAGGFAKVKLLPTIHKLSNTHISAIVDADSANGLAVARVYGAHKTAISDEELFASENDCVDAVVIASPHKFHAAQVLRALEHGKAVFVEKPMVTTFEQLEQIKQFLTVNPQARLCVDYNRSFSPFMRCIKQAIAQRSSPLTIAYRMNAGYIPKSHWIQTEVGAGRIIGEACHIVDLFCMLTDSTPHSISVEALHAPDEGLFPTDNVMVQMRMRDGSLCSLLYTALGHDKLGKERMELFFDGKSIVVNDFKELLGYGVPGINEKVYSPDKGHTQLLKTFFEHVSLEQFEHPIALNRLLTVAHTTLLIDQLACAGGGELTL